MKRHGIAPLLVVLVAVCGALLAWLATVNGAGLTPDSIGFIRTARALLAGTPVTQISTLSPPGFPMLLAGMTGLTGDETLALRLLSVLSAGTALGFLGLSLARELPDEAAPYLLLLALLTVIFHPAWSSQFWLGLSEGPTLAVLCAAIFVATGLARGDAAGYWLALAVLLCALPLLRYAALPLVPACLLVVALLRPGARLRIFLIAGGVGVLSLLPLAIWLWLASDETGAAARELIYHPLDKVALGQLGESISTWLGSLPATAALLFYLGLLGLGIVCSVRAPRSPLILLALVTTLAYGTFLWLSLTFFDANTPLDLRILVLLFPSFVFLLALAPVTVVGSALRARVGWGGCLLLVALIAGNLAEFGQQFSLYVREGQGFGNRRLAGAEVFRATGNLPAEVPIYTNAWEFYYLHFNREVRPLPHLYDPSTAQGNADFAVQWHAMLEDLRQHEGVVVWSPYLSWRGYMPDVPAMVGNGELELIVEVTGGSILRAKPLAEIAPSQAD